MKEGEIRIDDKPILGAELQQAISESSQPAQTPHEAVQNEEQIIEARRRTRLGAIAKEVEAIFLREDISMEEMVEVLGLFNSRAHAVFSKMKLNEIKNIYERS